MPSDTPAAFRGRAKVVTFTLIGYLAASLLFYFGAIIGLRADMWRWQDVMPAAVVWTMGGAGVIWLVAVRVILRLERERDQPDRPQSVRPPE